ncbi:hypothetical protein Q4S45_05860 [Massilia sp. R2A-15]|uniref:hypothetical protein n=1 Tax=Massilia sp. R2A-15 TaxID=3064278 RepID=UPI002734125F|nr:hypothetical protein [Massilia sp. R2A-15]WLI90643.1 hypothetical protein Q4S45_05860 [Massilia sp. R2A-15]
MNVKKFALPMMMALVGLTSGSAIARNQGREQVCLVIGKYAEGVAEARESGRSEKEALSVPTPGRKGTPQGDLYVALQQVISWVYTVQLPPSEARKLVYTKCLNREFFAYNPKLDG